MLIKDKHKKGNLHEIAFSIAFKIELVLYEAATNDTFIGSEFD